MHNMKMLNTLLETEVREIFFTCLPEGLDKDTAECCASAAPR